MVGGDVWTTEEVFEEKNVVEIHVAGEVVEREPPVTASDIKQIAREYGIKKFVVKDADGNALKQSDFPVEEAKEIYIEEYNEGA